MCSLTTLWRRGDGHVTLCLGFRDDSPRVSDLLSNIPLTSHCQETHDHFGMLANSVSIPEPSFLPRFFQIVRQIQ
jgi:hypothetical protein